VIAQQSGAAEQSRPGGELSQPLGLDRTDFPCRACAAIQVEEAMSLEVRNPCESALEPVGGAQRVEA
jgi:hypothetical protein